MSAPPSTNDSRASLASSTRSLLSQGNGKPSDSSDEDDELGGDGKLSFHNESLLALSPVVPAVEVLRGYMTSEETVLEYQVANGFSGGTGVGLPLSSFFLDSPSVWPWPTEDPTSSQTDELAAGPSRPSAT